MANVTINQLPTASTIDPTQDILPIYTAASQATQGISRNVLLGLSSAPVGLSDSQTLTNKTLTSPTINGATLSGTLSGTYTIGGTPTFPSSVATLTATQTLTNKILTSPTINSPTITNATITADTVSGFTTSNNGTVYGMSVTGGVVNSAALANAVNTAAIQAGAVGSSQIATNGVAASNLATSAITLGYAQITSTFTGSGFTMQQVTGLTITVTIPAGNRRVRITAFAYSWSGGGAVSPAIYDGPIPSGTQIGGALFAATTGGIVQAIVTPLAGSKTYNIGITAGSGTVGVTAVAAAPAFILVEAI